MDAASKINTAIHEVFVQFLEQKELLKMKITPRKRGHGTGARIGYMQDFGFDSVYGAANRMITCYLKQGVPYEFHSLCYRKAKIDRLEYRRCSRVI